MEYLVSRIKALEELLDKAVTCREQRMCHKKLIGLKAKLGAMWSIPAIITEVEFPNRNRSARLTAST